MNRLFEIMYILLDKKSITARELANHFEVSVRTIYRDIDELSSAGVPLYTTQGRNGGISILDNYVMNNALVSKEEQLKILSALQSQQELESEETRGIISKLSGLFHVSGLNWVSIDFSDWSGRRQGLFILVKECILHKQLMEFQYYNRKGAKALRIVEPMQLRFKGKTWYLRAFCRTKQEMRLFKLTRMKEVRCLEDYFSERTIVTEVREAAVLPTNMETATFWIDNTQSYRIYDDFEEEEILCNKDGTYTVTVCYDIDEWVYSLLLSYGHHIKVIAPKSLKNEIMEQIEKMSKNYL